MSRLWQTLETFPGPAAVPAVWKAGLGDEFDSFRAAFLRTRPKPAMSYPCPRDCGCAHEIVRHKGGPIVAVCQCEPCCCNDIPLAESDCVILELSWQKLGRAICTAFGFAQREAALAVPNAIQIGASGSESIPVMLTIPNDRDVFGLTLTALAAILRRRFILVAPTADFMDAPLQQILADLDALFVPLDTAVRFTATGVLEPTQMIAGAAERKQVKGSGRGGNGPEEHTALAAMHEDLRQLKQFVAPLPAAIAKVDGGIAIVQQHVRGVPVLQAELTEARINPEGLALEIQKRIADILTPEEQRIWMAVREAGGVQKDALPALRQAKIVNSEPTLSRMVKAIDKKLKEHGLPPCKASGPTLRHRKSGGYTDADGNKAAAEISTTIIDWREDPDERKRIIRGYLSAKTSEDRKFYTDTYPDIESEAKKYKGESGMKSG